MEVDLNSPTTQDISSQTVQEQTTNITVSTVPSFIPYDINSHPLMETAKVVEMVMHPTIFIFGVFGNVMIVIITVSLRTRQSSMDLFFLALAVCDFCVLVFRGMFWIAELSGYNLTALNDVACKLLTYLPSVGISTSCWLLVALTAQRALSVAWPHRVNIFCTVKRIRLVILAIVLYFSLTSSHMLYGLGVVQLSPSVRSCTAMFQDYKEVLRVFGAEYGLVIYSWLPFALITFCNAVLLLRLRESTTMPSDATCVSAIQKTQRQRKVNSVTLTVIAVSTSFILLTMPPALYNLVAYGDLLAKKNLEELARLLAIRSICYAVSLLNYSVNFYLYCLTGKRFRDEFRRLFSCLSWQSELQAQ